MHSNHDDMATIRGDYCSMILGVVQISSTTRNLVPRFKRGSKGEGVQLRHSNESSRSWLLFSKKLIRYVDVFIFPAQGHHDEAGILSSGTPSYLRRTRGNFGITDLRRVDYLVDNIGEGGGNNSRMEI